MLLGGAYHELWQRNASVSRDKLLAATQRLQVLFDIRIFENFFKDLFFSSRLKSTTTKQPRKIKHHWRWRKAMPFNNSTMMLLWEDLLYVVFVFFELANYKFFLKSKPSGTRWGARRVVETTSTSTCSGRYQGDSWCGGESCCRSKVNNFYRNSRFSFENKFW